MKSDSESSDEMADSSANLFDSSTGHNIFSTYRAKESGRAFAGAASNTHPRRDSLPAMPGGLRQTKQELEKLLAEERALNQRLIAFDPLYATLARFPDIEMTAQKVAEFIQAQINCGLACILQYQPAEKRFRLLAAAGPSAPLMPGSFQPDLAMPLFREARDRQHAVSTLDMPEQAQMLEWNGTRFPSLLAAPIIRSGSGKGRGRGTLQGLLLLADPKEQAFRPMDLPFVESAAARLASAWEYTRQNDDLKEFIDAITSFSAVQEAGSLMEVIASKARYTLNANYVLVAAMRGQQWMIRGSGNAPSIFASFHNGAIAFLEQALMVPYTFRMRDLRSDPRTASIQIDHPQFAALLASPIRIGGTPTGLLLAFGKTGEDSFSDSDVYLAERLASQAAANLESCYLYDELRRNLQSTQLLSNLILHIEKAENLTEAVYIIADTAYHMLQARRSGMVLFAPDGHKEAEVFFPIDDYNMIHPSDLIRQAMSSRQTIYLAESEQVAYRVLPLQTRRRCYGALWLELEESDEAPSPPHEEINVLINQAVIALERLIFNEEDKKKAVELEQRNKELQKSYEQTLTVLTRALDARHKETEEHVERVQQLAHAFGSSFGIEMGLSRADLKALELGALLHDIGKIGVPDAVLLKPGPLDDNEWKDMRKHPETGAQIIEQIPFLHEVLPVIKFHQERWDGSGYPEHRAGYDIPLLARIFAVIDVFDALTSDRSYREKLSEEEALEYLERKSGIDFDPEIVARFVKMKRAGSSMDPNLH